MLLLFKLYGTFKRKFFFVYGFVFISVSFSMPLAQITKHGLLIVLYINCIEKIERASGFISFNN